MKQEHADMIPDMENALREADAMVTKVINGEPGLMRAALTLAGTISQLRRKYGIMKGGATS